MNTINLKKRPPVELHRLISSAVRNPDICQRLRDDPAAVYKEYSLPDSHCSLLLNNPAEALGILQVHANLQFKFLAALGLLNLKPASIQPYLKGSKNGKNC